MTMKAPARANLPWGPCCLALMAGSVLATACVRSGPKAGFEPYFGDVTVAARNKPPAIVLTADDSLTAKGYCNIGKVTIQCDEKQADSDTQAQFREKLLQETERWGGDILLLEQDYVPGERLANSNICTRQELVTGTAKLYQESALGSTHSPVYVGTVPTVQGYSCAEWDYRQVPVKTRSSSGAVWSLDPDCTKHNLVNSPIRTIAGARTALDRPSAVVIDPVHNEIFVANMSSITVYGGTVTGDAAPIRTIAGEKTGFFSPNAIAIDTLHDEILVAHSRRVSVYGRMATGNVAPIRIIEGEATGIRAILGLAIDSRRDEIFIATNPYKTVLSGILIFHRSASGNVAPKRALETGGVYYAIAIDTVNDEIVTRFSRSSLEDEPCELRVYDREGRGDISPKRRLGPGSRWWAKDECTWQGIDAAGGEIFVADGVRSILVYDRTQDYSAPPARRIFGPKAGLKAAWGIAVSVSSGEIVVADRANNSVAVFRR